MGPYWFTLSQAAAELGMPEADLAAAADRGELLTLRRGDERIVIAAELERFRNPAGYDALVRADRNARLRAAVAAESAKRQRELRAEILALLPPGWTVSEAPDAELRKLTDVPGAGWSVGAAGLPSDFIGCSAMLRSEALLSLRDALRRRWIERELSKVTGWRTDGDIGPVSDGIWFDGPDGRRYLVEAESKTDPERMLFLMGADQGDLDAYDVAWIVPAELIGDADAVATALLALPDGGVGKPLKRVPADFNRADETGAIWVEGDDLRPGQPVLLTDGETAVRARIARDSERNVWIARPIGPARRAA